ncbi:transposase [Stenotrophomonas maltophilia]|uniref:transposase n=1 Tax=Stenotrophomonas maltophilia TaxID=40324 RepID=UPI0018629A7A|nr:transposase [Stenotrophomonas maltophilia]MDT3429952.1 transposase [Stenotrophomonas maltophilia]QNA95312.1 transposase [Stenotrophomonas maltophilia]QNA95558.1 transposase [Stenotrophomonas maltophilia]QNA96582.1 transposase [Stenotrophomonas maltophilia]
MSRITRRSYTDEFKHQAVELAESLGPAAAARQLEMSVKTLANWLDAVRAGRSLTSEARRPATDLESEISRLRAENANLKMEREILKKRRRSLPESPSEVRLRRQSKDSLPDQVVVSGSWGFCLWIP